MILAFNHRYFIEILYNIQDMQDPLSIRGVVALFFFTTLVRLLYGNKTAKLPEAFHRLLASMNPSLFLFNEFILNSEMHV